MRFQGAAPNRRGTRPGVFALCNGLARSGALSADDHGWWRASNDAFDLAYRDPATVDPSLFDRALHPVVSCWFRATATTLLDRVDGYLTLLDRHGVAWECLRSDDPGRIIYEDDDQVVVEPRD